MPTGPDFVPIKPRKPNIVQPGLVGVRIELDRWGRAVQSTMSRYPSAATDYVRTGNLGRRWGTRGAKLISRDITVEVFNNSGYAHVVTGFKDEDPHQGKRFEALGWPQLDVVGKVELKKRKGAIAAALQNT